MRAIVVDPSAGTLTVADRPDPRPGPGQLLVRVRAAGLNRADLYARSGAYRVGDPNRLPPTVEAGLQALSTDQHVGKLILVPGGDAPIVAAPDGQRVLSSQAELGSTKLAGPRVALSAPVLSRLMPS